MTHVTIDAAGRLFIDHQAIELEARRMRAEFIRDTFHALGTGLRRGLTLFARPA